MSSLPPELAGPVEHLRAELVKINDSEQTCMINAVAGASQGGSFPEVIQAIMARCRQASAAATTAIDTFRPRVLRNRHASPLIDRGSNRCCNRHKPLGLLDQVGELRSCRRV